jgi:uncharacterized protein YjbJ (UPF0337 family)
VSAGDGKRLVVPIADLCYARRRAFLSAHPLPAQFPVVSFLGDAKSSLGDAKSSLGDAKSSLGDAKSSLGDAESSLGDAKSSLGDAKSSLGDAKRLLGDAKSSLGDAKSSLGDAKSSLGDAKSSLGDAKSSLGDAKSSLGDAESSLGDAKSSLGDAKSSLGDTLRARWVTLLSRWVTVAAHRTWCCTRHPIARPPALSTRGTPTAATATSRRGADTPTRSAASPTSPLQVRVTTQAAPCWLYCGWFAVLRIASCVNEPSLLGCLYRSGVRGWSATRGRRTPRQVPAAALFHPFNPVRAVHLRWADS